MGEKSASAAALQSASREALRWVKTENVDRWAQILGDEREKRGLPRASSMGRTPHGTFKSWVRHIEKGETPCRLCTEAFEAKTTPLVRPPAEGVPADPVEIPKLPGGREVLQCEECAYTVDAASPTRRNAMAMHVRRTHSRGLLDSEAKPVQVAA